MNFSSHFFRDTKLVWKHRQEEVTLFLMQLNCCIINVTRFKRSFHTVILQTGQKRNKQK